MALILNIDTALDTATASLAKDGTVLASAINESQKDHAAWIQSAIEDLIKNAGHEMADITAVGVSNGPGSYTGLRIGLATAKGLCYALKIPLITVNSLEVIAVDAIKRIEGAEAEILNAGPNAENIKISDLLFCSMIDARRMEVFVAIYDIDSKEVIKPQAWLLKPASFEELLKRQKILFLGNGSKKFQQICENTDNAMFKNFPLNPSALAALTYENFIGNNFAGLAYTEPLYLKEFFTMMKKN